MPRHQILPSTATPEALAQLIQRNKIETRIHVERIDLEEPEIKELEHKSSFAGRQMDKLKEQLKTITNIFKKGIEVPYDFTITPTKGIAKLDENRKFADKCVLLGYTEENITLYGLPWAEKDVIVYVDIVGTEYPQYQEKMSLEQKNALGNSLFGEEESLQEEVSQRQRAKKSTSKAAKEFHEGLAEAGMKVTKIEGDTVHIETGHKKLPKEAKKFFESGELPESDIKPPKDNLINPFA